MLLIALAILYTLIGFYVAFLCLLFPLAFLPKQINTLISKVKTPELKMILAVSLLIPLWPMAILHLASTFFTPKP